MDYYNLKFGKNTMHEANDPSKVTRVYNPSTREKGPGEMRI